MKLLIQIYCAMIMSYQTGKWIENIPLQLFLQLRMFFCTKFLFSIFGLVNLDIYFILFLLQTLQFVGNQNKNINVGIIFAGIICNRRYISILKYLWAMQFCFKIYSMRCDHFYYWPSIYRNSIKNWDSKHYNFSFFYY